MLYEVITITGITLIPAAFQASMYLPGLPAPVVTTGTPSSITSCASSSAFGLISIIVITSYSIHYTKLYDASVIGVLMSPGAIAFTVIFLEPSSFAPDIVIPIIAAFDAE